MARRLLVARTTAHSFNPCTATLVRSMTLKSNFVLAAVVLALTPAIVFAQQLAGTVPVTTGGPAVVPTLVTASPGTFLAQATYSGGFLNTPFPPFQVTNFTMQEAVYRNASGAIDFYFQISSQYNGNGSSANIIQILAANFGTYATSVGFRPDGAALIGATGFTAGTVAAISAQRGPDSFNNNSVMFNFAPGFTGSMVSNVFVVSTNASSFTNIGDMGVFSPGAFNSSVTSALGFYSPSGAIVAGPAAVPESGASMILLGLGCLALVGAGRFVQLRNVAQLA
jgi:hypothetical protein